MHLQPASGSSSAPSISPDKCPRNQTTMDLPDSFLHPWLHTLTSHPQATDLPPTPQNPAALVTTSTPLSLRVGSGASIFADALLPAIASARREVILVTCFWAESESRAGLKETLTELARARTSRIERGEEVDELVVRICFSSSSPWQKLFHTWSKRGHVYPPAKWPGLGLPDEKLLREARMDMRVKTLFFFPFSVMHPKFLVVDGARAWVPSCNVSWETWFEACVEFEGPAVEVLLEFYRGTWEYGETARPRASPGDTFEAKEDDSTLHRESNPSGSVHHFRQTGPASPVPTIILPSSHHRNPRFNSLIPLLPIPFLKEPPPPVTPLNTALFTLFDNAQRRIQILTPNLTCRAVETSLLTALARGVDVSIVTSRNLMVLEQLVTALTTTGTRLPAFTREYEQLCFRSETDRDGDAEAGRRVGRLEVRYYKPETRAAGWGEPVVSHVKMVRVDEEFVVLGSGNMDRASWYTSQELGVMFYGGEGWDVWEGPLRTRTEVVFPR